MHDEEWDLTLNPDRVYAAVCPGNTTVYERVKKVHNIEEFNFHGWPPKSDFFNQVRERVFRVLRETQSTKGIRVERFRGAMDAGIDARRTLVGLFRGDPFPYVKTFGLRVNQPIKSVSDSLEPIVWIFQPLRICEDHIMEWTNLDPWTKDAFNSDWGAIWSRDFFEFEFGQRSDSPEVGRKVVRFGRYLGMVTFTRWSTNYKKICAEYGGEESAKQRVPIGNQRHEPPAGEKWWERLLCIAAHYAKEYVCCVTLDETGAYDELSRRTSVEDKHLAVLRGSEVGNSDVLKLSTEFFVNKGRLRVPNNVLCPTLINLYGNMIRHLEQLHPSTYQEFTRA